MKYTPIAYAIAAAYGKQFDFIYSAAWMWFEWTQENDGRLTYRWKL